MTRRSTALAPAGRGHGDGPRPTATLRPATLGDHRALEALLARASFATGENVDQLLAHPDALAIPLEHIPHSLIIEQSEHILGFCTVLPVSEGHAEIEAVFVEPSSWRIGLGRALLAAAERQAAATGATLMSVVSGRYAEPFYLSQGFRRSGTHTTRFGPAARLEKRLIATLPPDAAATAGDAA